MADYKLIGKDFSTPDLVAKVAGRAKYAEDFRAEGMLFAKLLSSPMPHARVRGIDTSEALAMPGVEAILTADDMAEVEAPNEAGLTNEPLYEGEPVLAVAAVDEATAAAAIERIRVDFEPLPFCLDPLDSLRPGGPNARLDGNSVVDGEMTTVKWTDADFAAAADGTLPMGEPTDQWEFGDVEVGLAGADLVLDETVFHQSLSHQPLETRTTMAYWQNGKVYVHPSSLANQRRSQKRLTCHGTRWRSRGATRANICRGARHRVAARRPTPIRARTGRQVRMPRVSFRRSRLGTSAGRPTTTSWVTSAYIAAAIGPRE